MSANQLLIIGLTAVIAFYVLWFLHDRLPALQAFTRPVRALFRMWRRALQELEQSERKQERRR